MGFPNVDNILVKLFHKRFLEVQTDPESVIPDLFEDLDEPERFEVAQYLLSKNVETDIRKHDPSSIYILKTFPLLNIPFPQISVTLGQDTTDRYIGDETGESTEVRDEYETLIGYDVTYGFYSKSNWDVHVVTATKDEAIWLSQLCRLFIVQSARDLGQKGILEIDIMTQDPRIEEGTFQPSTVFSRALKITATLENTWKERVPAISYQTGVNKAFTQ